MGDNIAVGWTIASVLTSAILSAGALMWADRKVRAAWACFMAAFFPMVVSTLVWAPTAQDPMWRIMVSGIVGAIFGSLFLIGATQLIHDRAVAQSGNQPDGRVTKGSERMSQNITSYNQSGGIIAGTVNIGPGRLAFSDSLGAELLSKMPIKKKVNLKSIGGNADQAVASEFQNFLQQNGYEVARSIVGTMSPPPDGKISLSDNSDGYFLMIAPSAN